VPGSKTTTTRTEAMKFQNVASAISTDSYSNARRTVPANGTRLLRGEKGYVVSNKTGMGKGVQERVSQGSFCRSVVHGAPVLYIVGSNVIGWTFHS
jgi:hypothetical protein